MSSLEAGFYGSFVTGEAADFSWGHGFWHVSELRRRGGVR